MKAYISVGVAQRVQLEDELNSILTALNESGIEPFIFVDKYKFKPAQEKEMMEQAMADIEACDILIAETSEKAIGIGIEAGYAKGKNKPIIYLRNKNAEHSTTMSGLSNFQIIYEDELDLATKLDKLLKRIAPNW